MKKLFLSFLTLAGFALASNTAQAQATGDYRTVTNGSWNTLSVWERYNGSAWVAADHAPSYADGKITIQATDTITLPSGTTTVDQMTISSGGKLTLLSGSTLSVRNGFVDDLTINGSLEIQSGGTLFRGAIAPTLILNGEMIVAGKLDAPIVSGTASKCTFEAGSTLADSLTNNNVVYLKGGDINFDNATFINNDSVRITGATDVTLNLLKVGTLASTFTSTGKIVNDSASTQNVIVQSYISLTNSGTINISNGSSGSKFSESEIHNNASFTNSGTLVCYEGSIGSLKIYNETAGTMSMNNGTVFQFNNYLSPADFTILTNNAALSFNYACSMPLKTKIDFLAGSIGGSGSLIINGTLHQEGGGSISLPLTVAAAAFYEVVTGDATYNSAVTNGGLMSWQSTGKMILNNTTITNNATFNQFEAGEILLQSGTGGFVNNSIFNLQFTPPGIMVLNAPFTNNTNGKFKMQGNDVTNNSTFTNYVTLNFGTGGTAAFVNSSTGVMNLETGTSISETGSITNNGTCNCNVDLNIPFGVTFTSSGTVAGTGAFTIDGTLALSGGSISNLITIDAGAVCNINAASSVTLNKNLVNSGTINWSSGNIILGSNTSVTNNTTFNITGDNSLTGNISTSSLLIGGLGTFNKTAGSGATTLGIPVTDSGTISINSGSITIQSTFAHTGLINFQTAGIINNTGAFTISGTGKLKGTGTFNVSSPGSLVINNSQRLPRGLTINSTKTTISGTGSIKVPGVLNMIGGTLSVVTNIKGTCQLDSTVIISAAFENSGLTIWNSGNITLSNITLTNSKDFNINAADFEKISATGSGTFLNNGSFIKGINSVTIINTSFTNSSTGTIGGIGQYQFNGTLTNNGNLSPGIKKIGQVSFNKNPITSSSAVNIEIKDNSADGFDILTIQGSVTVGGTLNLSEVGSGAPAGTYDVVVCTGTLSGTFSAVNKPSNWTVQYTLNALRVIIPSSPLVASSGTGSDITIEKASKFIVYPNPVTNTLNVQLPASFKNATLIISDMNGKTIQTISNINAGMQQINAAGLAKGMYVLTVKTNSNTYSEKFVKE
ncbi:MAG TPA: T9SS type A sorting domain-containing protein [Panacibacter sp.]|nr:T9SS type A sorting domain-containing protein [Panacibacter sp.]